MTLSTQPYRGTRDFYPEDFARRQYIFDTWRRVLQGLGYEQYDTPLLENAEIYIQKSGEELGGQQLYNFYDKGERHIALRPEMTPSLARLVANKFGELRFPLRWFSIPNCFRYERPQKGRVREHWQLNVDIIGLEAGGADLEVLTTVSQLFVAFGANSQHFKIVYNHRGVLDKWLEVQGLIDRKALIYKVLDDWFKESEEHKRAKLAEVLADEQIEKIWQLTEKRGESWEKYLEIAKGFRELKLILDILPKANPGLEYDFNPCIIRGLAYYTGLVFEAFDKNPDNPRALFGGGRYDNLLDLFGKSAPGVGFGWGDVTMATFLDNWELWPEDLTQTPNKVGIMPFDEEDLLRVYQEVIPGLRENNQPFEIDYDYSRSENKRYETLKKRGCTEVIKLRQYTSDPLKAELIKKG